ncbi:cupin domain-containing protein [Pyxidicoccus xibeiensis]|uniref:cupin domain-containing protein n=1 Tax=Pyxidicoccus xibeiensis TaxID=2906759 RepID=UPI0020A741AE|nr:cupin domain-containing protein [Pyxidicoccus xibeiensis]MCP3140054.1 cupin domain-containing protein [Pyxidicoccus xibeiensis]
MRPRFLIPVLAVGFGAAALSWAREPKLQLAPQPPRSPAKVTASAPVLSAAAPRAPLSAPVLPTATTPDPRSAPVLQAAATPAQLSAPVLQAAATPAQLAAPVLLAAATPTPSAKPAPQAAPASGAPAQPAPQATPASGAPARPATSAPAPASDTPATQGTRYRVPTSEAPRHIIAGGKGRATLLLNPSTGATAASMTLLELQPGGEVPEHVHATSAELLYIEDGAADMVVSGQKLRVAKGDAVYIPAGEKHSARVVSQDVAFRAVQVYAGPGPEARFTQGPRENPPHGK